jgi:hypothetical protein
MTNDSITRREFTDRIKILIDQLITALQTIDSGETITSALMSEFREVLLEFSLGTINSGHILVLSETATQMIEGYRLQAEGAASMVKIMTEFSIWNRELANFMRLKVQGAPNASH